MYYLVYKITNKLNNKIYIGCHITEKFNDKYMGSGRLIRKAIKKYGLENFTKAVLYNFDNQLDMLKKEAELVNKEFIKRKDTYNITEGGTFNTKGIAVVKDANGNVLFVPAKDKRIKDRILVGMTTGLVPVKDINGNIFSIGTNDPKYLSGEFVHISKGLVTAKDKDSNYYNVSIDDERIKSGELVGTMKGLKHTDEAKKKIGMANKIHQMGSGNNQYGTCWIYNVKLKENKKIKTEDLASYLIDGWIKGRKMKF
jgi:hypothetical protein